MGSGVKLFDAHCHLQDPRIHSIAPHLIRNAFHSGVLRFAINGVSENDWRVVKEMAEQHPCLVPNFGLHPWYVAERTPNWFFSLREFFASTPSAAVGEIGLDKGSHGKTIDFGEQVEVFQQQLELAKELKRPASVHCVRAFGDLLEILKRLGPFPEGLIMHSYLGSAEMVPELAKLGCYFSFSGFLSSMSLQKAKKMIRSVPLDRILLESDAPDALPKFKSNFVSLVQENSSALQKLLGQSESQSSESSDRLNQELNHPANIHSVLNYASSLLEMPENELAEVSYRNAIRLFSFPGSKVCAEGRYAEGKRSRGVEDYDDISQSPMHTPSPSVFTPNDSRQASPIHEMEDDDIMQVEPPSSQPRNSQTQSSSNDILRGIRDQDGQRRKRERTGKKPQDSIFNMDKYIAFRERENKEYMDVLKGTQVVEKHTIEDCMKVFNEMSVIFTDEEMFKATQIFIKDKSYRELFLCLQKDHRVPWLRMMFNKIE